MNYSKSKNILNKAKNLEKITTYLNKGYNMNKKWNKNNLKLSILINECINIEKNFEEISGINNSFKNLDINLNTKIIFVPEKEELNNFLEKKKISEILSKQKISSITHLNTIL